MNTPDIGSALQTLVSTFLQLLNWCGRTLLILKIVWSDVVLEKQLKRTIHNNLMQHFLLLVATEQCRHTSICGGTV